MTTRQEVIDVIKELTRLADGGEPASRGWGICSNIEHLGLNFPEVISSEWPDRSDSKEYPVAGGSDTYYSAGCDKWDFTTTYGRQRRDLCYFMIDWLEEWML